MDEFAIARELQSLVVIIDTFIIIITLIITTLVMITTLFNTLWSSLSLFHRKRRWFACLESAIAYHPADQDYPVVLVSSGKSLHPKQHNFHLISRCSAHAKATYTRSPRIGTSSPSERLHPITTRIHQFHVHVICITLHSNKNRQKERNLFNLLWNTHTPT